MNERIKQLAEQAFNQDLSLADNCMVSVVIKPDDLERFAELVRQDHLEDITGHTLKMVVEAIAREREACAELCDDWFAATAGAAIRARGKG